jgi:predicted permease
MDNVIQDIRFAVRSLIKQPSFALVAVAALAVGIGANTAIFSVVNGVILRPLPYEDPDGLARLVRLENGLQTGASYSVPDLRDIQSETPSIEAAAGYSNSDFTVTEFGTGELIAGARVTEGLLAAFRIVPHIGRDLRADEAFEGGPRVVVVSHALWQERLGADPGAVGDTLRINGEPYEIVGVAPPGFEYPGRTQLWAPAQIDLEGCGRGCHLLEVVARLKPGADLRATNAELALLAQRLEQAHPEDNTGKGFLAERLLDNMVGDARRALWLMLGAVGMVLLIACANVANVLLIRASGREGEVAVRYALGAGRGRIVRQLLIEAAVLASAAGALGLLLAGGALRLLLALAPGDLPRLAEVRLDATVLLFGLSTAAVVSLVFGLTPALRLARAPLTDSLRRGRAQGIGAGGRSLSRAAFLTAEVALSLMLLLGAGLLQRSFAQLTAVELGYDTDDIVRFSLSLPEVEYETPEATTQFFDTLEERLAALPGVRSVGLAFAPPLSRSGVRGGMRLLDRPEPEPGDEVLARWHTVSPGYFETMGIPLLRGRGFESTDRHGAQPVVLVSETFAQRHYPDGNALGKQMGMGISFGYPEDDPRTVIGVVGDVRGVALTRAPEPEVYVPMAQAGPDYMTVMLRADPGADLMSAARAEVLAIDPMLPLRYPETMNEVVARAYGNERFYAALLSSFAGVALLLAAVGMYGVVGYMVAQRTHEIAMRLALGATRAEVVWLVLRQGALPVLAGLALGLAAAVYATGQLVDLLYDTEPIDPFVFTVAAGVLAVVAAAALMVPAGRASRIEPMRVLKQS